MSRPGIPDSDPPPPASRDPRRRSYNDLRGLEGLDVLIQQQRALMRQTEEKAEERAARRSEEAKEQRDAIDRVGARLGVIETRVTTDVAELVHVDRRLGEVETIIEELVAARHQTAGAIGLLKVLIPVSIAAASGLTYLLAHLH